MQLDIFPDQMVLRRKDPTQNMNRFYRLVIQRDLFGGADLIREWGHIGMSGKVRVDHHPDEGRAVDALMELISIRRKRGYR